jgi:tetratricopeptide (TPR) repeat protein
MDPAFIDNKMKNVGERSAKRIKKSLSSPDKLLRWRQAARLVQVLSDSGFSEEDWNQHNDTRERSFYDLISDLKRDYIAFCPDLARLTHSCVPNGMIEGTVSIVNPGELNEGNQNEGSQPILMSLIALQDIGEGELLTISKIPNLNDLKERAVSLRQIFGQNFECMCIRCRWERFFNTAAGGRFEVRKEGIGSSNSDISSFSLMDLKNLGDLAMQQARYSDACAIYDEMLRIQPHNADVLHARCATFLERGVFREAQRLWRKASDFCNDHEGISLHVRKQEAYEAVLDMENRLGWLRRPQGFEGTAGQRHDITQYLQLTFPSMRYRIF